MVVESTSLIHRRLGREAVRDLHEILDPIPTLWVEESQHGAAVSALLAGVSAPLVDLVSFELMRRLRIGTAFAFDRHFEDQGFRTVP
jgi:uncharacterized protein